MTEMLAPTRDGVRRAQRGLVPYALRLTRWPMLVAGIAASWLVVVWRAGDITTADGAIWLMRSVSALVAVSMVFALDDPSVDTTRSLPAARGALMRARFGVAGVAALIALAPATVVSWEYLNTQSTVLGVVLEVVVFPVLTLSVALVLQRQFGLTEPAQFLVLVVFGMLMVAQIMGARWPLLVGPGPEWVDAHWRWTAVLVVASSVGGWQLRDPASRPLKRFLRR